MTHFGSYINNGSPCIQACSVFDLHRPSILLPCSGLTVFIFADEACLRPCRRGCRLLLPGSSSSQKCLCRFQVLVPQTLSGLDFVPRRFQNKSTFLRPEANIKSNTGWAVVAVVVVDTCLNPLCSDVHITSPPLSDACPNGTTNGCRPVVFNTVWDCAWLLFLLRKSTVTNAVQLDKKRHCPPMLRPPEGWNQV